MKNYKADLKLALKTLQSVANQLDRWAKESVEGGWSTHQVTPMRTEAARIRVSIRVLEK